MNRDPAHTSPLPTEPLQLPTELFPKRNAAGGEAFRQTESVTQSMPLKPHEARAPADTEPVAAILPAQPVQPAAEGHTEQLGQLEMLSALIDQELRKSDPAAPVKSTPPEPASNADEESLQTYLDRFMERVTGKKTDTQEPPVPAAVPSIPRVLPAPVAPPPKPQPREPARAPECREKMAAMRDLANENVRTAMNLHAGRHQWRRTKAALVLATVATMISSVLAIWNLATAAPGTAESAACTGLIAVYLACRFFWRSRSLAALI